jgi:hypothetical protein
MYHSNPTTSVNENIFQDICRHGTFYYPASSHYGYDTANVVCDRCKDQHLDVCVGYKKQYDLCLRCVQEICKNNKKMPPVYVSGKFTKTSFIDFPFINGSHKQNVDLMENYSWGDKTVVQESARSFGRDTGNFVDSTNEVAPFGYDKNGHRRTHWCTTNEQPTASISYTMLN